MVEQARLVNMGSPFAVGKKPEFVIQKRPDAVPNMMDRKRMMRKFRCVGSSFGRSRSTTIFFFFAMASPPHISCSLLLDQTKKA